MHDRPWAGIDLRLQNARDTLDEARKVLQRPALGVQRIVQESAGAIIPGHDWQSKFYSLVTRFLAEVRAVPWIIEAPCPIHFLSERAPFPPARMLNRNISTKRSHASTA
jgi:hypothetical protein